MNWMLIYFSLISYIFVFNFLGELDTWAKNIGAVVLPLLILTILGSGYWFVGSYREIDPEVQPYIDSFEKTAMEHGIDVSHRSLIISKEKDINSLNLIQQVAHHFFPSLATLYVVKNNPGSPILPSETLASCKVGLARTPTIVINQKFWNHSPHFRRQGTTFVVAVHELAHCWLLRGHTLDRHVVEGREINDSAMYPIINTDFYYLQHKKEFNDELFSRSYFKYPRDWWETWALNMHLIKLPTERVP